MSISAVNSSLNGIQAAQAQMDSAATTIAGGGGDLVDGIIDAKTANVAMAVNTAMLRQAMDADKYLIDVLVR